MKTLVYSSIAVWSGRLHVLLAVAQETVDAGGEVVYIGCNGGLPSCVANLDHAGAICRYCTARNRKGVGLLGPGVVEHDLNDYLDRAVIDRVLSSTDPFDDLAALQGLEYSGAEVGYAALSSYITATRDPDPDLADPVIRAALQRLINAAKLVYEALASALRKERPDRVVIFNGRLTADRAVLAACEKAGIDCDVYEITQKHDHVTVFRNALTGDIASTARTIEELWDLQAPDRVQVAETFFEKTRNGVFTNDLVFVDEQTSGKLPPDWNDDRKNIVIFGSSEDEFAAIGKEWDRRIYGGQAEGAERISRALADDAKIRVYLRLHPNMAGLDRAYARDLLRLEGKLDNLIVLGPESDYSSYALLDRADTVVTFGSTLGIEAVYWGRPSVLLVSCFYRSLGGTYNPETHEEVVALLRSELAPKDRTPALKMGYYRMKNGFRQSHFDGDRRDGPRRGYFFKGDRIAVRGLLRARYKLAKRRMQHRWGRGSGPDLRSRFGRSS